MSNRTHAGPTGRGAGQRSTKLYLEICATPTTRGSSADVGVGVAGDNMYAIELL